MKTCTNCGKELADNALFCLACGHAWAPESTSAVAGEAEADVNGQESESVSEMSVEESISFASSLIEKYKKLQEIDKEIRHYEMSTNRVDETDYSERKIINYWWPSMIFAGIIVLLGAMITRSDAGLIVTLSLAAACIVAGFFIALKKCARANEIIRLRKQCSIDEKTEKIQKLQDLKITKRRHAENLYKYEKKIPAKHRNIGDLSKACELLRNGTACNLEEALKNIK